MEKLLSNLVKHKHNTCMEVGPKEYTVHPDNKLVSNYMYRTLIQCITEAIWGHKGQDLTLKTDYDNWTCFVKNQNERTHLKKLAKYCSKKQENTHHSLNKCKASYFKGVSGNGVIQGLTKRAQELDIHITPTTKISLHGNQNDDNPKMPINSHNCRSNARHKQYVGQYEWTWELQENAFYINKMSAACLTSRGLYTNTPYNSGHTIS